MPGERSLHVQFHRDPELVATMAAQSPARGRDRCRRSAPHAGGPGRPLDTLFKGVRRLNPCTPVAHALLALMLTCIESLCRADSGLRGQQPQPQPQHRRACRHRRVPPRTVPRIVPRMHGMHRMHRILPALACVGSCLGPCLGPRFGSRLGSCLARLGPCIGPCIGPCLGSCLGSCLRSCLGCLVSCLLLCLGPCLVNRAPP